MATRDYVKRGKAPRKPTRNLKKKSEPSPFPIKWALAALVLVLGLGFGLYSLSSSAPSNQLTTEKTDANSIKTKKENTIPPKPQEKWTYIEELENKEVHVEAKEQELSNRPYLMQCGAYKLASQANERKAMIAFQGLESNLRVSKGKHGSWYRVVLGPYLQKREAERHRNLLRKNGIEPCEIWFWD